MIFVVLGSDGMEKNWGIDWKGGCYWGRDNRSREGAKEWWDKEWWS